jgi:hypothetical protein
MLLARQTGARATLFTAANFTLREGRRKVNEGSYLLACKGGLAPQTVAPRNCLWRIVVELQAAAELRRHITHKAIRYICLSAPLGS